MNINTHFAPLKGATPPCGIDKLILQTKDFEVKDTRQLTIVPNAKKQGEDDTQNTPLFHCNGAVVNGSKAYHNSKDEGGTISANINWAGLSITYNPSKMLGKNVGELSSVADVQTVSAEVEKYLFSNGIVAPLSGAKIYRIDLAKDRSMNQKVFAYSDVFNLLRAKGYNQKVQYPHGVRIGNRKRQGIFYDKGRELFPRGGDTNTMRGEVRLMTNQTLTKRIGISTMADLYHADTNYLNQTYNHWVNVDMFHYNDDGQIAFDFVNEVSILQNFKEQGRNAFKRYLMLRGVEATMLIVGGMDNLKRLLSEVFHRNRVNDCMKEVEELMRLKAEMEKEREQDTLSSKYEELRLKFVA